MSALVSADCAGPPADTTSTARPLPIVRASRLSRTFHAGTQAVVAVHGATFEIGAGDRIAIVGPSGSGKSTLAHLIAGLDAPTTGTLEWPAIGARPALRPGPVAIVFQAPSLIPALDVSENVALPQLLQGVEPAAAAATAMDALARLELTSLAKKLPDELSGGQAQRVAVARAIAGGHRLLVADEPTGQLDQATGAIVIDSLLTATGDDAALVVITHDPAVAAHLERQWAMHGGGLVTDRHDRNEERLA